MGNRYKGLNPYSINGEVTTLYITTREHKVYEVLIDTEDLPKLQELNLSWTIKYAKKKGYFYARATNYLGKVNGKYKYETIYLHLFLCKANFKNGEYVDHENHNSLDNRKLNFRVTESNNNCANRTGANSNSSTGHRNVNWGWNREFYFVQFMRKGERFCWAFPLSKFNEACEFADKKRIELFGNFAGGS